MIKVMVVDDSSVARVVIKHILDADPDITVVGTASDGIEAVEMASRLNPDLITMDIEMPRMDGFEATRSILQTMPVPIIIVSSSSQLPETEKTFHAIEAGALAVLTKPSRSQEDGTADELIRMVKLMVEVKVITRRYPKTGPTTIRQSGKLDEDQNGLVETAHRVIAIGASAGGPQALDALLSGIARVHVPILVAQHIAVGFVQGLGRWLAEKSGLPVHVACHGDQTQPDHVYLAPDGHHLGIDTAGRIDLSKVEDPKGSSPSVEHLFNSVRTAYGHRAIGVLLSGMGSDGAEALLKLRQSRAITIAQDEASSLVFGMPAEAVRLDAARYILPPEKIAEKLSILMFR